MYRSLLAALVGSALALAGCSDDVGEQSPTGDTGADGAPDTRLADTTDAGVDSARSDSDTGSDSALPPADTGQVDTSPIGEDRPAPVFVPSDYDSRRDYPLVFLLHGYSANGQAQDIYLGVSRRVDEYDFVMVLPEGETDNVGNQYWNATPWCCGAASDKPDDSAYLSGLIEAAQQRFSIDPNRVYFMGHSNGGFMSYRMACDHADQVSAIVSLAGSGFDDETRCEPSEAVSVLQVHGTDDSVVQYDGVDGSYPGAEEIASRWANRNGCAGSPEPGTNMDLVGDSTAETTVETWPSCASGSTVELWSIDGGGHIPGFDDSFTPLALDFLFAH